MKPKKCSRTECTAERMRKPGNTMLYFKYCQQHQIEIVLSKIYDEAIKDKAELDKVRKNGKKISRTDKQRALDLADKWFSRYIRFKYSFDVNGSLYCTCYTCGNSYLMMAMDNGHFAKRENKSTRFHENNARPQCTTCNDHHKGEYAKFEQELISEIGIDNVEIIKMLARQTQNDSEEWYKEIADTYRNKCNQLFEERETKNPWTNV